MSLRTIDHTFRRADYRIREQERERGAMVRVAEDDIGRCVECDRRIRIATRYVGAVLRFCIPCSIATGLLVKLEPRP